jgi:hypothetical protein
LLLSSLLLHSYRVATDSDLAQRLCAELQKRDVEEGMRVKCFFDKQDIQRAEDWRVKFRTALQHSCLFVPLVSEAGIASMKNVKPTDTTPDNFLVEMEDAVKLRKECRLAIFPILIGQRSASGGTQIPKFNFAEFGGHRFPDTASSTKPKGSVRDTLTSIFSNQGVFLADSQLLEVHERQSTLIEEISAAFELQGWSLDGAVQGKKHWVAPRAHKALSGAEQAPQLEKTEQQLQLPGRDGIGSMLDELDEMTVMESSEVFPSSASAGAEEAAEQYELPTIDLADDALAMIESSVV